jgi:hypothetical protein
MLVMRERQCDPYDLAILKYSFDAELPQVRSHTIGSECFASLEE